MDSTGAHAPHPDRPTVEADPAYDYSEDLEVDEDWDEQSEVLDDDERTVPLDEAEEHREADEAE
ncbi:MULTISPECIES: hypothetical protein [Arthrobacter]|uniref:Uncharacterized protein n=1 Tax=Arthrobacter terricola TaxID=2547396 RepID=A0A4R5KIK7_9MICC|nr:MULTISPECIES: hypothetical protein [Arthrobacter]MBT8161697.1 hypothetical protein [Arthrobacter sp. GN70]TDF95349.1 hypothetical protein E1809_12660 [Arthrobacter terricola]